MGLFSELLDGTQEDDHVYVNSILTGVVKEIWNTKYPGMVHVEYILSDQTQKVTDWIRVATPYGGNAYGMYAFPEIGTEVVIGFVMGDINSPIVIGCLWNQTDALPQELPQEKNTKKAFMTKGGNQIIISDEEGKESIQVITKGKLTMKFCDEKKTIEISDGSKNNSILMDSDKGEITIKAKTKLKLSAGSEEITMDGQSKKTQMASNQVGIEGKQGVQLKSSASLKAEGAMVELKAQSSLKAEASGIMQLKGAMTKIN